MFRFVTPAYFIFYLALVAAWRKFCKWRWGSVVPLPVYLRFFVWLYGFLALSFLLAVRSVFVDIILLTSFWDDASVERYVSKLMHEEEEHPAATLAKWREEASLEDWTALKAFSLTTPFWVLATLAVCSWHTYSHVRELLKAEEVLAESQRKTMPGSPAAFQEQVLSFGIEMRRKIVMIIALPFVYGLMSLEGVVRMWGVSVNHVSSIHRFRCWLHRLDFNTESYEAAFCVADLYEAYALLLFGLIISSILRRAVNTQVEALGTLEMDPSTPEAVAHRFERLSSSVNALTLELKGLTCLGIKLFCLSCFSTAVYKLVLNAMAYFDVWGSLFSNGYDSHDKRVGLLQTEVVSGKADAFWCGCGLLSSFAAIGNIMQVEQGFHTFLQRFGTMWKFWCVKILVSIAFIQSVSLRVVPPMCWWTTTRANLFYSSLLCVECFVISLCHVYAWGPYEDWYSSAHTEAAISMESYQNLEMIAGYNASILTLEAGGETTREETMKDDERTVCS
eukprot:TRINITY_DN36476_c0_g2_i1.p1 TRINITY_DN36476_c0_g2~~TRINITY_DN36476_c0_g2_i1.p1  ORF type:complete len:505 (-),score=60.65 TRINITY_DN36476_c0_g2_i1:290-1804(-)